MRLESIIKTALRHELLLIILFAQVILRIPNLFEPYWYGDEGIYLVLGQGVQNGMMIYRDIIDHKTPIIYFLAAVPSQFWFKFVLLIWTTISSLLLYKLALRLFSSKWAAIISAAVYMFASTLPTFEGNIANGELFVIGFILLGAWYFTGLPVFKAFMQKKAEYTQHPTLLLAVGMLFSLGVLTKVPAIFDIAAFYAIFLFIFVRSFTFSTFKRVFMSALYVGIGILIPILLSIAYFAANNALNDYAQFGLLYNFHYTGTMSPPFTDPILLFAYGMIGKLLITAAGVLLMVVLTKKLKPTFQFLFVWAMLALFATLLSSRPYPHYWLQAFPPLALLIGYACTKISMLERGLLKIPFAILVITLVVFKVGRYPTVSYYTNFVDYATKKISVEEYRQRFNPLMDDTYSIAEYIKKTTMPDQRMFIWGTNPMLYALADRRPAGRFTVAFHIQDLKAYDETIRDITTQKPPIIVVMKQERGEFTELYALLAKKYVLAETTETMSVYRKISKD